MHDLDRNPITNISAYLWGGFTWGAINLLTWGANLGSLIGPCLIALGGVYASWVSHQKVKLESRRLELWEAWLRNPVGPPPPVPATATVPGVKGAKLGEIDEVA